MGGSGAWFYLKVCYTFHLITWKNNTNFTHRRATPPTVFKKSKRFTTISCVQALGQGMLCLLGTYCVSGMALWGLFHCSCSTLFEFKGSLIPEPGFLPEATCKQCSSVGLGQGGQNGRPERTILEYGGQRLGTPAWWQVLKWFLRSPACDVRFAERFLLQGLGGLGALHSASTNKCGHFQRFRKQLRSKGLRKLWAVSIMSGWLVNGQKCLRGSEWCVFWLFNSQNPEDSSV